MQLLFLKRWYGFSKGICILTLSFWVLMFSTLNMERKKGVTERIVLNSFTSFSTAKQKGQVKTVSKKSSFFSNGRYVEQILTASCGCLQEAVNPRFADVEEIHIFISKLECKAKLNKFLNSLSAETFVLQNKTPLLQHCHFYTLPGSELELLVYFQI